MWRSRNNIGLIDLNQALDLRDLGLPFSPNTLHKLSNMYVPRMKQRATRRTLHSEGQGLSFLEHNGA